MKLAIIVSHPIQYNAPWFKYLSQKTHLDLLVFYLDKRGISPTIDEEFGVKFTWDVDLLSGYNYVFVANRSKLRGSGDFWGLRNPSLYKHLIRFSPDAILLFGFNYWTHIGVIFRRVAPLIFRGDSTLFRPASMGKIKRLLLGIIYSRFTAFLPVGSANAAYFRHCLVPSFKLFPAPHCVDIESFSPTSGRIEQGSKIRNCLGITETDTVLLFAGKFVPKKCPTLLLRAFIGIRSRYPNAHLVFSGNGELSSELLRMVADTMPGMGSARVHFLPFANQTEMPARYLMGDVLVLPSLHDETWGLAVNEAMHLARPAIVSNRVGCHPDLIIHGKTGWTFPAGDESALATRLEEVLQFSRDELAQKGKAAQLHAASFSYENATKGLLSALSSIKGREV